MTAALYERLGQTYQQARRPDARIADQLAAAIGDPRTVINVGAGTGSYEPTGCHVVAVEPAAAMRAQRPPTAAPCIAASAEALPFDDTSIDVAMGVYTDFHWSDRARGIAEMIRVARHSVVLLTVDSETADSYWLIRDYFPEGRELFAPLNDLLALLPGATAHPVMIPEDCQDGFVQAFWKRPHGCLTLTSGHLWPCSVVCRATRSTAGSGACVPISRTAPGASATARCSDASSADLAHRLVTWTRPS